MTRLPGATAATLRRLLALARDLLQASDPRSVLELTGPAIQELLLADGALLLLALNEQEHVTEFDGNGVMQTAGKDTALYRYALQAIDNETPVLLPDITVDPPSRDGGLCAGETVSLIAFPFPPIKPVGALAVFWYHSGHPHQLSKPISVMRYIGELTAAALGNVGYRQMIEGRITAGSEEITTSARIHAKELHRRDQVEAELHQISVTDVMTGMLNRRGFFLNAERSFKVARRQGVPSVMIYADLDELKTVNDELGHDTGDSLIQDAGRILRESFRDSDVVARLGGDEFAAFTLDAAQPEAILARIQSNIESFRQRTSPPYRISLSIGIVQCNPTSDLTMSDYLSLADKQMYEQKNKSRSKPGIVD
jgi:diguanylate cyclase (GGDEF)-like protein